MNEPTWFVVEILAFLAIFGCATMVTVRLRSRMHEERGKVPILLHVLANLVYGVSRPLAILLITWLLSSALGRMFGSSDWIRSHAGHLEAWRIFWIGVAAIGFIEALIMQTYALRRRAFPVPDLLLGIIRSLLVLLVAFAVLKLVMGVNIAPLLASTALVTAVVGFALQGVLGDLLAGMSMNLVCSFRAGEWISVDELEGRVVRTNWRETQLRTIAGHHLTIPNGKVAGAIVHNMERPTALRRHTVCVGASYHDEPDEVIAALLAAVHSLPEALMEPKPAALVTAFQDFGINYEVDFWTTQFHLRRIIDAKAKRMIWYQFKRRGIEIPFPMSDKLLNDFMTAVQGQRRLVPDDRELVARAEDLLDSDLCTKLVVDSEGRSLLSREALLEIAPLLKRSLYTQGETIFTQGEEGAAFHVVARGKLAVSVAGDKDCTASFALGRGAVVGEMSLMTGAPRSATVTVSESAELLEFDIQAFRAMLALRPDIPEALATLAAHREVLNREALERASSERDAAAAASAVHRSILDRLRAMIGVGGNAVQ